MKPSSSQTIAKIKSFCGSETYRSVSYTHLDVYKRQDIGLADSYGINAVRALGLPGKYAPEEAGRLIFKKAQPLL